jgi:hypothetical protein
MDFATVLQQIPPTAWAAGIGAAIGALASLPGLGLSLRHARLLQAKQLAHDSAERTRERQMAWRRQVYLESVESIARLSGLLGRMADLNFPDSDVSRLFQDDHARISRIQVIAKDKMVAAVNAYLGAFGSAYIRLGIDRGLLVAQRNEIESLGKQLQNSTEARARCEMLLLQSGQKDDKICSEITIQMEVHRQQAEQCARRRLSLMSQLPNAQTALLKASIDASFHLSSLLTPALLAAREELELPLDVEQYNKQSAGIVEVLRGDLAAAMERVDKAIADEEPHHEPSQPKPSGVN